MHSETATLQKATAAKNDHDIRIVAVTNEVGLPKLEIIASSSDMVFVVQDFREPNINLAAFDVAFCFELVSCSFVQDIVIVWDISMSFEDTAAVGLSDIHFVVSTIINSLNLGPEADRAAFLIFAKHFTVTDFTTDKEVLTTTGNTVTTSGFDRTESHLSEAIQMAAEKLVDSGRDGVTKTIFLITDGMAEDSVATLEKATAAKNRGIRIAAVTIEDGRSKLEIIASSSDMVFVVQDFTDPNINLAAFDVAFCFELPSNPCTSNPCLNDGTCTLDGTEYDCNCPDGYSGDRCDTEITYCSPSPCQNSGTCNLQSDGFTCTCPPQFQGPICNDAVNPCNSSPCGEHGTCTADGTEFSCSCQDGYTGLTCGTAPSGNECSGSQCLNGGTCVWFTGGFFCYCRFDKISGDTGPMCGTPVMCPVGNEFDPVKQICFPCPNGFWRGEDAAMCLPCPKGEVTGRLGSSTASDCVQDPCPSGTELLLGSCVKCPKGSYKRKGTDVACQSCPDRFTTKYSGARSNKYCKFRPCSSAIDVMILVDVSNNAMINTGEGSLTSYLSMLAKGFRYGRGSARVGVVQFATMAETIIGLRQGIYSKRVCKSIEKNLRASTTTTVNLEGALMTARDEFMNNERNGARKAILVISANEADDIIAATALVNMLKAMGIHVTAVSSDLTTLANMATDAMSQFLIPGYSELADKGAVLNSVCGTPVP